MNDRPISDSAFLGVEQSLLGKRWRARLDVFGDAQALALVQRFGLPDPLARVLAGRGVLPDSVETFLAPTLRALMPDPSTLRDADAAVGRLASAISRRETVAIFGDYDVDGACSAALLAEFLDACGVPRIIHIPDRIGEGYGPNIPAIRELAAQGATLLVCVDCGTTSHDAIAAAKTLGLDAIVLDHHQAPEILPDAIIVNPNRQDCLSGLGMLCAAGVVFMVLVALNRQLRETEFWTHDRPQPDLLAGLDLVALATVADVAPLVGLNRAFVQRGLEIMQRRVRPGLAALADVARLNGPPEAWHLGFLLGPRINAGGRIGDSALGARLLLERDPIAAAAIAASLDKLNGERRAIESATCEAAAAQMLAREQRDGMLPGVLVAGGEDWHPGVVGLVASRLKERFGRPAFAIAWNGDTGTGSGRSIAGVDLGAAVRAAVEAGHLAKGGGHAMAAGVTLGRTNQTAFEDFLAARLASTVERARTDNALRIDASLSAAGATTELMAQIARAGPFGAGNPEPVFALAGHRLRNIRPVGEQHLKVVVESREGITLEAMAFRMAGTDFASALQSRVGQEIHIAVGLSIDHWGGRPKVAARVIDAAPA